MFISLPSPLNPHRVFYCQVKTRNGFCSCYYNEFYALQVLYIFLRFEQGERPYLLHQQLRFNSSIH